MSARQEPAGYVSVFRYVKRCGWREKPTLVRFLVCEQCGALVVDTDSPSKEPAVATSIPLHNAFHAPAPSRPSTPGDPK